MSDWRRSRALLLVGAISWTGTFPAAASGGAGGTAQTTAETPGEPGRVMRDVRVERVLLDAHVTDLSGFAIEGLAPADFDVFVDDRRANLESVDWVAPDRAEVEPLPSSLEATTGAGSPPPSPASLSPEAAPGRLIVLFFQSDIGRMRLGGLVRMTNESLWFLDKLLPTDRVAVVSFDSHLKLRQDFTADRRLLETAVFDCVKHNSVEPLAPGDFPSLARTFDFAAARDAATVERALAVTARALSPIAGAKSMLFFGWGLGIARAPSEGRDYAAALQGLAAARVSVFSLDITEADAHTLEGNLEQLAVDTGGTYQKTHLFPRTALSMALKQISGRYVLVLVKPERAPQGTHSVRIELVKRKGRVLTRPFYQD